MQHDLMILEADIIVEKETAFLKERASSIITLPEEGDRQVDLMYFSAIYVSSGENLNHAYFEPTEMVMAENTIVNKALDIEHEEKEIVGHLYDRVFIDKSGNKLDIDELKGLTAEDMNTKDIHIAIAGIIYKHRFPEVAQEVAEGRFKVSMETYYEDFDIKIGDMVITRQEAQSLGFTDVSGLIGKAAKIIKSGKELATGTVARVLRNIKFSGCGLVENPANPPSVILEVASHNKLSSNTNSDPASTPEEIVIDFNKLNKVTSSTVDTAAEALYDSDDVGTCVYYKRRVLNKQQEIIHDDWCSKFATNCSSFSRGVDDPECLLHNIPLEVKKHVKKRLVLSSIVKELTALEEVLKRK